MNNEEIQGHLERVKDLHYAFKSPTVQRLACRIVRRAVEAGSFWPDDVVIDDIPKEDRNCVGSTYRLLCNIGIIDRDGGFRRSEGEGAKGRLIFRYWLKDPAAAKAFLKRNETVDAPDPGPVDHSGGQLDLPI